MGCTVVAGELKPAGLAEPKGREKMSGRSVRGLRARPAPAGANWEDWSPVPRWMRSP